MKLCLQLLFISCIFSVALGLTCEETIQCGNSTFKCVGNMFNLCALLDKVCFAKMQECSLLSGQCFQNLSSTNLGVECMINSGYPLIAEMGNCLNTVCKKKMDKDENEKNDFVNKLFDISISFLRQQEGFKLKIYVPTDKFGKVIGRSGPTVATGIDLGQRTPDELNKLDIPQSLKDKLAPYCNKRGQEALEYVQQHPLTLSETEAEQLDRSILIPFLKNLISQYDANSEVKFEDLPAEAQKVILSVGHQFGHLPTVAPSFWEYVSHQEWEKAAEELRNWNGKGKPDQYQNRRETEAKELEKIKNKKLKFLEN